MFDPKMFSRVATITLDSSIESIGEMVRIANNSLRLVCAAEGEQSLTALAIIANLLASYRDIPLFLVEDNRAVIRARYIEERSTYGMQAAGFLSLPLSNNGGGLGSLIIRRNVLEMPGLQTVMFVPLIPLDSQQHPHSSKQDHDVSHQRRFLNHALRQQAPRRPA